MPTHNKSIYYTVELNLKEIADPTVTETYYFTNRAEPVFGSGVYAWPLLLSVNGIGSRVGEYLPQAIGGTVVFDNSISSIGYERRLQDLFERYSPIDQDITIYALASNAQGLGDQVWKAKVISYFVNIEGTQPTITFNIASETIPKRVVTKLVEDTQFTSAEDQALGKYLPIVLGSGEVAPIRISADGAATPQWAYATTLGSRFVSGGVATYYLPDDQGIWGSVTGAATTTTALYAQVGSVETTLDDYYIEIAGYANQISITGNYVLTIVAVKFIGTGNGSFAGGSTMRVGVWKARGLDVPFEEIAFGEAEKATYDANFQGATTTNFDIYFSLNVPVVINSETDVDPIYITFTQTVNSAGTDFIEPARITGTGQTEYQLNFENSWLKVTGQSNVLLNYQFFGATFTDTPTPISGNINSDGLGHAYFTLDQRSAAGGQEVPDLSKLNFICNVNGLKDDSSGTITGAASSQLTELIDYFQVLDYEWNGSTWVAGKIAFSKFSATHPNAETATGRSLGVVTEGRTTLEEIYAEMCAQSACKITQYNGDTKQLAVYAWGSASTDAATLDEEHCKIIGWQSLGTENVINRVLFYYDQRLLDLNFITGNSQGEYREFASTLNWYASKDTLTAELSELSELHFGVRELQRVDFPWIRSSTTAEEMAYYFSAKYGKPPVYVELECPYFKYSTLDILDTVKITHPDLPAFFGTSSNARLPDYNNDETDILSGRYWKRAQQYRGQIEGKFIDFREGQFPLLRLRIRLLLNNPKDPT